MLLLTLAGLIFTANTVAPPLRFDHPHAGGLAVHWLNATQMQLICHTRTACSHGPTRGVCHVYIAAHWQGSWLADAYVRHEVAHCNGWPINHPD